MAFEVLVPCCEAYGKMVVIAAGVPTIEENVGIVMCLCE
jgi:hypothetical protein